MEFAQATQTLNKMDGLWNGLDKRKNKENYKAYGTFLLNTDYQKMDKCIDIAKGISPTLPSISDLNALYRVETEKEKLSKKEGEYKLNCMVCLDHGIVLIDRQIDIGRGKKTYQFSCYCDSCEKGRASKVYHGIRDGHNKRVSFEMVDTPISKFIDTDMIAESNSKRLADVDVRFQPLMVCIAEPRKIPPKGIASGIRLLEQLGIEVPDELKRTEVNT